MDDDLSEMLSPFVNALEASAKRGNGTAKQVIALYEMHRRCPSDPGAYGLCRAAFDEWTKLLPATAHPPSA